MKRKFRFLKTVFLTTVYKTVSHLPSSLANLCVDKLLIGVYV